MARAHRHAAVRRRRDAPHVPLVPEEGGAEGAGCGVPHAHGLVLRGQQRGGDSESG